MKRKRMKKLLMSKGIERNLVDKLGKTLVFYEEVGKRWTNQMLAERIEAMGRNIDAKQSV